MSRGSSLLLTAPLAVGRRAPNVFLSYRRREGSAYARLVYERLGREPQVGSVFMDVEGTPPGTDWPATLRAHIAAADVVLVLIGREWLDLRDPAGKRRLDDPKDFMRFEIAEALRLGKRVVPVRLDGAPMPPREELPADIAALADQQAKPLDHESFDSDLQALLDHLTGRRVDFVLKRLLGLLVAAIFLAPVFLIALAVWGVLDLFTHEVRIGIRLLAAASLVREPPVSDHLKLVAVAAGSESPGPEFRAQYAKLVDALVADGAAAIVIDVRFRDPNPADAGLAAAFAGAREKGTLVYFAFNELRDGKPRASPALAAAASVGFACAGRRLGIANAVPIVARREQRFWPALALAAAVPGASITYFNPDKPSIEVQHADARQTTLPLSYVEKARVTQTGCPLVAEGTQRGYVLIQIPAEDALRSPGRRFTHEAVLAGDVTRGTFKRKTVVVGVATDEDKFEVARGLGTEKRFGYELHAIAASALATGSVPWKLDHDSQGLLFMLAVGLGAFAGYATHWLGRARVVALLVAIAAVYFVTALLVCALGGVLLNPSYDLLSFLCMFLLFRSFSRRWLPWDSRRRPAAQR